MLEAWTKLVGTPSSCRIVSSSSLGPLDLPLPVHDSLVTALCPIIALQQLIVVEGLEDSTIPAIALRSSVFPCPHVLTVASDVLESPPLILRR